MMKAWPSRYLGFVIDKEEREMYIKCIQPFFKLNNLYHKIRIVNVHHHYNLTLFVYSLFISHMSKILNLHFSSKTIWSFTMSEGLSRRMEASFKPIDRLTLKIKEEQNIHHSLGVREKL